MRAAAARRSERRHSRRAVGCNGLQRRRGVRGEGRIPARGEGGKGQGCQGELARQWRPVEEAGWTLLTSVSVGLRLLGLGYPLRTSSTSTIIDIGLHASGCTQLLLLCCSCCILHSAFAFYTVHRGPEAGAREERRRRLQTAVHSRQRGRRGGGGGAAAGRV